MLPTPAGQTSGPVPREGPGRTEALVGLDGDDVLRLRALRALRDVELDPLVLVEALVALRLDGGEVDEDVGTAAVLRDEAEALLGVEPLHGTLCHVDLLESDRSRTVHVRG